MPDEKSELNLPTGETPAASMEEIIASISRIIDEDNRTSRPATTAPGGMRGVLELTEAIEADGSIRKLPGASFANAEPGRVASEPSPTQVGTAPLTAAVADSDQPREGILSAAVSEAAVAAFGRLGTIPRGQQADPETPAGAGARTLEEIVRDALRPLLRAWLDDHLLGIVERLVGEEIQRVVGEAGLR